MHLSKRISEVTVSLAVAYAGVLLAGSNARPQSGIAFYQTGAGALSLLIPPPEPIASRVKENERAARLSEYKRRTESPLLLEGPMLLETKYRPLNGARNSLRPPQPLVNVHPSPQE